MVTSLIMGLEVEIGVVYGDGEQWCWIEITNISGAQDVFLLRWEPFDLPQPWGEV